MIGGLVVAWYCYLINPKVPAAIRKGLSGINTLLDNKYYADWFNEQVLARGTRLLGRGLWQGGDRGVIDGIINGSARFVDWSASVRSEWRRVGEECVSTCRSSVPPSHITIKNKIIDVWTKNI